MSQHRIKAPPRKRQGLPWVIGAMVCLAIGGSASAQLGSRLGSGLGLPLSTPSVTNLPGQVLGDAETSAADAGRQAASRIERMRALVRAYPRALDVDESGDAVVRGAVIALDPSPTSLNIARQVGFWVSTPEKLDGLDLTIVTLTAPAGLDTRAAVRRLRTLDPTGRYDYDHLYSGAGQTPGFSGGAATETRHERGGPMLGLIDTGVASDHPAFARTLVRQQGFAPGGVTPAAHGTAVASLLVGEAEGGRGEGADARLFAADVYGHGPTGGSADAIVHALAWLGQSQVPVINVSLVGPPNILLEAAVRSLTGRGVLIVAPVGNDGPAAPPPYPASYPGVIAVTAVDGRHHLLPEAGRGSHLNFAAPGADIRAARPGGGYAVVRGTSFASPIVAGELARLLPSPNRAEAAKAVQTLADRADQTGGPTLGMGLVGEDLRGRKRLSGR
jgi:hypothetical protein